MSSQKYINLLFVILQSNNSVSKSSHVKKSAHESSASSNEISDEDSDDMSKKSSTKVRTFE